MVRREAGTLIPRENIRLQQRQLYLFVALGRRWGKWVTRSHLIACPGPRLALRAHGTTCVTQAASPFAPQHHWCHVLPWNAGRIRGGQDSRGPMDTRMHSFCDLNSRSV